MIKITHAHFRKFEIISGHKNETINHSHDKK